MKKMIKLEPLMIRNNAPAKKHSDFLHPGFTLQAYSAFCCGYESMFCS